MTYKKVCLRIIMYNFSFFEFSSILYIYIMMLKIALKYSPYTTLVGRYQKLIHTITLELKKNSLSFSLEIFLKFFLKVAILEHQFDK